MEDDKAALSQELIGIVNEISSIQEYRITVKKQYTNLSRRLKLLTPMLEEIRDSKEPLPDDSVKALASLLTALQSAKDLLRFGSEGSKIYLVDRLSLVEENEGNKLIKSLSHLRADAIFF
ncbi:hypothetical protein RD792_002835 [Penstemon davidsonii]|uniref:PUB 12/19-like N-terminal domain-containing protein n=1 Tax=Penstemon davidsonii TaxID=160366 RepID=A0ABR0DS35_9LAMI|nr:hypothetical protein RD792_002835 [Penstemon davidsonii]